MTLRPQAGTAQNEKTSADNGGAAVMAPSPDGTMVSPSAPNSPALSSPVPTPRVKPHPVLFGLFCVLFAIWIGVLVWIYCALVYPVRHHPGVGPTIEGSPQVQPMQP